MMIRKNSADEALTETGNAAELQLEFLLKGLETKDPNIYWW